METVIARTLALQRKSWIEAADLIFDFSIAGESPEISTFKELVYSEDQESQREKSEGLAEARNGLHSGNKHREEPLSTGGFEHLDP